MPWKATKRKSIWVNIKLDGEGFANSDEFDLRYTLEDAVQDNGIGELEGAGSGGGWMDFSFGVADIAAACRALGAVKDLLTKYKVPDDLIRLEVINQEDQICDSLPNFQVGDCLSYRFEDGDYGALIVLSNGVDGKAANINYSQRGTLPPVEPEARETLVGVLDYKEPLAPSPSDFEKQNWLLGTHHAWKGQPYRNWLHCFGGIEVKLIHKIPLEDEAIDCRSHLSWDMLGEYFIREKYHDNKELNPYESGRDAKSLAIPKFVAGDCLRYRFADGDFGAAIVLKNSDGDFNEDEMLLGILDYKRANHPDLTIFEARKWLVHSHEWNAGLPILIWAHYCWHSTCHGIDAEFVNKTSLRRDDPQFIQLCLFWEAIPEFVEYEMKSGL
jgi:hypothetical protein